MISIASIDIIKTKMQSSINIISNNKKKSKMIRLRRCRLFENIKDFYVLSILHQFIESK